MKSSKTLFLAVVALVVGGVVYWDYRKGDTTDAVTERRKKVVDIQAADVTRLELVRSNQTIVVEKSGETWNIKQPLAVRANPAAIGSILDNLEFAERKRTLSGKELAGISRADFGLDQPKFRAVLQAKKTPVTYLFGNSTPAKDAMYVQVEGQTDVILVRNTLIDQLDRGLDDLRDRTVIEFVPAAATRLEIKSAQRIIELVKSISGTNSVLRWTISRPLATRADHQKVSDLLTDLSNLQVINFVTEDAKEVHNYQLDEPVLEISVYTGDSSKTLFVGSAPSNETAKVYAKSKTANSIVTVSADTMKKFAAPVNDLRDAHVLSFKEADVQAVELVLGMDKVVATRSNQLWKLTAPATLAGVEAEESVMMNLLGMLENLTIKQFTTDVATDLDKYGLVAPVATISLLGSGTNVLSQLLVGSLGDSNSLRYVKRADELFVYGVDTNIVEWLPANILGLRTHRLAEFKPEQITKFTVQKGSTKFVTERAADGKWRLIEPAHGALNVDGLESMLIAMSQLHARSIIRSGSDDLSEYGLDIPAMTVSAYVGDKPYVLAIGKPLNGLEKFASWSEPGLIIRVAAPDLEVFARDLVAVPGQSAAPAATSEPAK